MFGLAASELMRVNANEIAVLDRDIGDPSGDEIAKPFELQELVLRLSSLDRRRAHQRPPVREIAGLRLDPFRHRTRRRVPRRHKTNQQQEGGDRG